MKGVEFCQLLFVFQLRLWTLRFCNQGNGSDYQPTRYWERPQKLRITVLFHETVFSPIPLPEASHRCQVQQSDLDGPLP